MKPSLLLLQGVLGGSGGSVPPNKMDCAGRNPYLAKFKRRFINSLRKICKKEMWQQQNGVEPQLEEECVWVIQIKRKVI
jgi:hypothetical protein